MNISASQLSLYRNCPAAYKFKYIDGIESSPSEILEEAMRFGTEFHENVIVCKSEDPKIQKMVLALHNSEFSNYIDKIDEKEDSFVVQVEDFRLRAILDANCEDYILEFKTASKPWEDSKFETEIQPTLYQFAEFKRTGKVKEFIYFIVTKTDDPRVQIWKRATLPEDKVNELLLLVTQLRSDFEFEPTGYKKNACFFCDYKDHCPVYF